MKIEFVKTLFVKFYIIVGSFFVLIYTANQLGAHYRGVLGVLLSLIAFLHTIFYLSIGQIIYSELNKKKDIKNLLLQMQSYNIAIIPILTIVCIIFIYFYDLLNFVNVAIVVLCVFFLIIEQQYTSMALALDGNSYVNRIQIITKTIYFISSLISVVYFKYGYVGILLSYFISSLLFVIALRTTILSELLKSYSIKLVSFKTLFKKAIKFHINAFGQALYNQAPMLIMAAFVPFSKVANIEMAFKIIAIFFVVGQSTQQVVLSKISQVNDNKSILIIKEMMLYASLVLFFGMILSYNIIDYFVADFLSSQFNNVSYYFKLLLPIVLPFCMNSILLSIYIKKEWYIYASKNNILIGVVSATSAVVFCSKYDSNGFIYSYYVTAIAMIFVFINVLRKVRLK